MSDEAQDECKGGDSELRPQFDQDAPKPEGGEAKDAKKVRLTTGKYVQLLIDARETDPDCWPPGLEKAAGLIERARAIEDACLEKWGEFDPEKLTSKQSREYFEIQLALDTLQDEAGEDELSLDAALDEARSTLAEAEPQAEDAAPSRSNSSDSPSEGYDLPAPGAPPTGGFFAAPLAVRDALDPALLLSVDEPSAEEESHFVLFADGAWSEVAPVQRPENYA